MHFVLSYDLSLPAGDSRQIIEKEMETVLNRYRNVHQLSTFYVVHVANIDEWETIRRDLSYIATHRTNNLSFIMSPPMTGGHYNGILPGEAWRDINGITDMDV